MIENKTRRVSMSVALFDRLEKIANERLISPNLIVEKAVERYVNILEGEPSPLP